MRRNVRAIPLERRLILAIMVTLIIAGGAFGTWYAWDNGIIGNNLRAPTTENFMRAVKVGARLSGAQGDPMYAPCIHIGEGDRITSFSGLRDITNISGPGFTNYVMALKTKEPYGQKSREFEIARLDFLAKAGIFVARDLELTNTADKPVPAKEYTLTAKGWKHYKNWCFASGTPEVLEITGAIKLPREADGSDAYEIKYRVGIRTLAEWATQDGANDWIKKSGSAIPEKSKEHTIKLLRGSRDWIPEQLAKLDSSQGGSTLSKLLDEIIPPLTEESVKQAIAGTTIKACLALPENDDTDGTDLEISGGKFAVTYLDGTEYRPETPIHKAWRRRFSDLAKAGLFLATPLEANSDQNRSAGVRYSLDEQYSKHLEGTDKKCLSLGETTIESITHIDAMILAAKGRGAPPTKVLTNIRGIAKISPAAWSRGLDLRSTPEAQAFLVYGVPFGASLTTENGKWKTVQLSNWVKPMLSPWPEIEAPIVDLMPKATNGTELHLISVYEPEGAIIDVEVKRRAAPIILVLSAYDHTGWRVKLDKGAKVSHVVLMGYNKSMAFGPEPLNVVRAPRRLPSDQSRILNPQDGEWSLDDIEKLFGRRHDSWQMAYRGRKFAITDYTKDGAIISIEKPIRRDVVTYQGSNEPIPKDAIRAEWNSAVRLPAGAWEVGTDSTGKPVISRIPKDNLPPSPPASSAPGSSGSGSGSGSPARPMSSVAPASVSAASSSR